MADPFAVTLVLMYFTATPAKDDGKDKYKREATAVWTLQSTQQIEAPNSAVCVTYALKMLKTVKPVNNLTMRAYCLCPYFDETDKNCYHPTASIMSLDTFNARSKKFRTDVTPIGPDTPEPALPPPPPPPPSSGQR
jgi:hypothetical protein